MTFSKLSRGGRVCGAGSRGQAEMLQQIYSLWRAGLGGGALSVSLLWLLAAGGAGAVGAPRLIPPKRDGPVEG